MRYYFNKLSMESAGKSDIEVSDRLSLCSSTITKKKKVIYKKIIKFLEDMKDMTTIYVNGKRVTKEDLNKMEIRIESVKRIILEKLTKNE